MRNRLNKLDEDVDAVMSLIEADLSYQADLGCENIVAVPGITALHLLLAVHRYVRLTRELIDDHVADDAIHVTVT